LNAAARLIFNDPGRDSFPEMPKVDLSTLPRLPERRRNVKIELKMEVLYQTLGTSQQNTQTFRGEEISVSRESVGGHIFFQTFSLEPTTPLPGLEIEAKFRWAPENYDNPGQTTAWKAAGILDRPELGKLHGFGLRVSGPSAKYFSIRYQATNFGGQSWPGENGTEIGHWEQNTHIYEYHDWCLRHIEVSLRLK
jgi:hypothetical protein